MQRENELGRFGHHPDPAIDFCVEVECLYGLTYNIKIGLEHDHKGVLARTKRAMEFRVGGDEYAVRAKGILRQIEAALEFAL